MRVIALEITVALLGLLVLVIDLWTPPNRKKHLGYLAIAGLVGVLLASFSSNFDGQSLALGGGYLLDAFSLYFKRFFLVSAILVLMLAIDFAEKIETGIAEMYVIILFALMAMMFAASANDFPMLFVSLETVTVCFYVLNSFQRRNRRSLEAGVKYLILGALSTAFLVYGIAFIYGVTGETTFEGLAKAIVTVQHKSLLSIGCVMLFAGLSFKIAAFPFPFWTPDVYEGSPLPSTAFLAIASKATGFVLLLRLWFTALPAVAVEWSHYIAIVAGITILYGNLCAIPQRNLKRLLGYSSISNAGYLLLGLVAINRQGPEAILYFLTGYLFTLIAAFTVIHYVTRESESEDIEMLAGLGRRSPLLASSLVLAMVSLAGIPPMAGFFGKFLLIKAVLTPGATGAIHPGLVGVAIIGVVISLYYYFGVVRAMFWGTEPKDLSPISISWGGRISLVICIVAMLFLGLYPNPALEAISEAVKSLGL